MAKKKRSKSEEEYQLGLAKIRAGAIAKHLKLNNLTDKAHCGTLGYDQSNFSKAKKGKVELSEKWFNLSLILLPSLKKDLDEVNKEIEKLTIKYLPHLLNRDT